MQKRDFLVPLGGVVVLISLAGACNKEPTSPAPPRPAPVTANPGLTRVEISGPDTIAPGTTVNFKLTGFLADGTTRDVTAEATWRSSNVAAATIDQSGAATGKLTGETQISASIFPHASVKAIAVMPAGTYKLVGSVVEESANVAINNAQVDVRNEAGLLLRVSTVFDGSFRLLGVPADAELQVTRGGYVPHTQRLHLSGNSTLQVRLKFVSPPVDVSGTYTLTIGGPACPGAPPHVAVAEGLRQRTYTAVVTQRGSHVDVTLTGAQFATVAGKEARRFSGRVDGTRVSFTLYGIESPYYFYYSSVYGPDVAERLADGTALVSSGQADLTVSGSRWDGTLNGNMRHLASVPSVPALGRCSGPIPLTFAK